MWYLVTCKCVEGIVSDLLCTIYQINGVSLSISALLDRLGDLQQHVREEDDMEEQQLRQQLSSFVAKLEKRRVESVEAEVLAPETEQFLTRRFDHVDSVAARDVELVESIQEKYKIWKL